MNTYEYMFLDPSEIKDFSLLYEEYGGDETMISYESLKEIVLSYPKYDKNISLAKLNSLYKQIKDNLSQYGDKEYVICIKN
jgi:hypothetical protein